jgi:hypothetical protein
VRNSSLVERQGIDDNRASSIVPKLRIVIYYSGRGAFQRRRSRFARNGGVVGKANVGISNENAGEKPARQ